MMIQDKMEDADARASLAEDLGIEDDGSELQEIEKQEAEMATAKSRVGVKRLRNGLAK